VARREGFEPPTARSVVSHHPSPPGLLLPPRPCWSCSTAMSLVRLGHPSPPVTCGMVAIWSQFRPSVARSGVWRQVALLAALCPEHQTQDLVLSFGKRGRQSHSPKVRRPGRLQPEARQPLPGRCHHSSVVGFTNRPRQSERGSRCASPDSTARSAQSNWGRATYRQRTATSCRNTSSSALLVAERRVSTSHPSSRPKIR
jgi:hypothetical protein